MRAKITPINPKRLFDVEEFKREKEKALDDAADYAELLYTKTAQSWNTDPEFFIRKRDNERFIGTRSSVYIFVDLGTKPHVISAKTPDGLRFQYGEGYKAKTAPNVIGSGAGSRGNQWARKQSVNHPGSEARNFTKEIQKEAEDDLAKGMKAAIAALS